MPGTQIQNLLNNLNIDTQIIHNLAHLLYSNVNRSCVGHPLCDLSQDRQLSGLRLQADLKYDQKYDQRGHASPSGYGP